MPNDMTPPSLPVEGSTLTLTPQDAFTRSLFDGIAAKEYTARLEGAVLDRETDKGEVLAMLRLSPVGKVEVQVHSIEAAMGKVAQGLAEAMPPPGCTPEQKVLADLVADPATHDVAVHLIAPLLARDPPLAFDRGKMREELFRTAHRFKVYAKRKLTFAAEHLLKGKHTRFPDHDEIFASLGRYDAYGHGKGEEEDVVVNGRTGP